MLIATEAATASPTSTFLHNLGRLFAFLLALARFELTVGALRLLTAGEKLVFHLWDVIFTVLGEFH